MFLIFPNDPIKLLNDAASKCISYADDTNILICEHNLVKLRAKIEVIYHKVISWANENDLNLNEDNSIVSSSFSYRNFKTF